MGGEMKNNFSDLNDRLFAQLERLADDKMTDEQLLTEVTRANAMVSVSNKIVSAAALQLKAVALVAHHGGRIKAPANLIEHRPAEGQAGDPSPEAPERVGR